MKYEVHTINILWKWFKYKNIFSICRRAAVQRNLQLNPEKVVLSKKCRAWENHNKSLSGGLAMATVSFRVQCNS